MNMNLIRELPNMKRSRLEEVAMSVKTLYMYGEIYRVAAEDNLRTIHIEAEEQGVEPEELVPEEIIEALVTQIDSLHFLLDICEDMLEITEEKTKDDVGKAYT